MTNDAQFAPGSSKWRALSGEDAERCIELHGGRWPTESPVFDERQSDQHRPSMDDDPSFYDRDRRYGVKGEED
jgi:hypothetical protein